MGHLPELIIIGGEHDVTRLRHIGASVAADAQVETVGGIVKKGIDVLFAGLSARTGAENE
jgi:hypothetical protein